MNNFDLKLVKPHKLKQVNTKGKRFYVLPNGKKYPSVTTYLNKLSADAIAKWRENVGEETANAISKRALDRGNAVHKSLEKFVHGHPDYLTEAPEHFQPLVKGVTSFLRNRVDEVYGIELPLYSTRLRAAGTADLFCRMDGVITLGDFKTAEKIKREAWILNYFYQATIYALMVYERYDIKVPQIAIMIATENDGLQVFKKPTSQYIDAAIDFITTHELYKQSQSGS